jgi:hypothetical protein
LPRAIDRIQRLIAKFAEDVRAFYPPDIVERGYIEGRNRGGEWARFPLLAVSAAVIFVPPHDNYLNAEGISGEIAQLKRVAKRSPGRVVSASVNPACLVNRGCDEE